MSTVPDWHPEAELPDDAHQWWHYRRARLCAEAEIEMIGAIEDLYDQLEPYLRPELTTPPDDLVEAYHAFFRFPAKVWWA